MIEISLHDRVALLIDADNAQPSYMENVLKFSKYFGKLTICRAYGDWTTTRLISHREKYDALQIERVQVKQIGKNATDHRLLVEIGELLADSLYGDRINVFIIVSGDGDFASACDRIKEQGSQVIGIGNQPITSNDLQSACEPFYFLEDLEQELENLERHYPIPPDEVRAFYNYLFKAYFQLALKNYWVWVSYSKLGAKLREVGLDYKSRFGKFPLSLWLKHFKKDYETHDQMVRRIDPHPEMTRRGLLYTVYQDTKRSDGLASLSAMDNALRERAGDYEEQFGGKELIEWIKEYPDLFKIHENDVILCLP